MRNLLMITAGLAALAAGSANAGAENPAPEDQATQVAPVTVIATRTATPVDEVPATVSVISAEQIERMLATDYKDLVRYEPGVSVPTSPARFSLAGSGAGRDGNAGFTIRGMGGDRVLIVNDGVRLPGGFSFGAQAVGRGGYNDLDLVKTVEILRGPASALYGSDGVAGAVSFTTKDPQDFLVGDQTFGARARVAYNSADEGWTEGVAFAGRAGSLSGLLAYTRRDSQETENQGTVSGFETGQSFANRTLPNPQDMSTNAVLGKLVWDVAEGHTLRLTYDHLDSEMDGDAITARSATVLSVIGHDETQRDRVSLDWRFKDFAGFSEGFIAGYWQDATTRQYTYEDRTPAVDRVRDTTFDNAIYGLAVQGLRIFGAGSAVEHRVTIGGDWSMTTQEGTRDGVTPPVGETFPVRAFPRTEYQTAGLFVQDDIKLLNGALSIIPAVRYDWYDLSPKPDALFPAATTGQSEDHISPKIGVVYWTDTHLGVFANYSLGFRAPTPMQVNNYFENPVFGYRSVPNPDLRPETSESFEAGFRLRDIDFGGGKMRLNTIAFATHYEDFIDQVVVSGTGVPGVDPLVYQYVNLTDVDIRGLEARADIFWENGVSLNASAAYAEGTTKTAGRSRDLSSVDPLKVVAGVNYAAPSGVWGGSAIVTVSSAKESGYYDGCAANCALSDGFAIVDLIGFWNVTPTVTARVGVFNLLDEKYTWWSDVRGVAATSAVLDAYTQPGRNVGVSLSLRL
jgi:hemoglobin/transferrin/lactoferrin receptor protein